MIHISEDGLKLIMQFEGFCGTAKKLAGERYYTIGYGHYGPDVKAGQKITKAEAEHLLRKDVAERFEDPVRKLVTDIPMTQNRFDALVSYCYNRGAGGVMELAKASHTVEEYSANIERLWGSAVRYKEGLQKRRKAERALFDRRVIFDRDGDGHTMDTLKRGDNGQQVRALQLILRDTYEYRLNVDGDFGGKTEEAVKRFQSTCVLTADGIAGPKTWKKLLE